MAPRASARSTINFLHRLRSAQSFANFVIVRNLFSIRDIWEMTYKRRKNVRGDGHLKKSWRTKRRTKDLDEIDEDIKDDNAKKLLNQDIDLDKPGSAQHYCVHCARYFINDRALEDHFNTKVHKRRLKALELEPYTIEESERAAGHGNWQVAKKRKIETLTVESIDGMDADKDDISKPKITRIGE